MTKGNHYLGYCSSNDTKFAYKNMIEQINYLSIFKITQDISSIRKILKQLMTKLI